MAKRKVFSSEQIIMKLREAEVLLSQGKSTKEACRVLEISEQTYYRWRKEYGGLDTTQARKLKELDTPETPGGRSVVGQRHSEGGALKKVISPDRRRQAVEQVQTVMDVSERRVCRVLGQPRSTQRYRKHMVEDEEILIARMVALASEYGRYGYRRVTAMLRQEGWQVNHKRVERLWRREGLKVPAKQPKRGRLWLNDGSIVRLRAEFPKHVWSYDFMEDLELPR